MHEIHYLSLGINAINMVIVSLLFSIYLRNYRHIKSRFNLGLIVFSMLFFAENLSAIVSTILTWSGGEIFEVIAINYTIINIIELLGLLTLLYITRE